jgi:hypothetical protein
MAAAVHRLGPETDLTYANTARVMRQALHWAGLLHGEIETCFESYDDIPPVTQFYDALTSMIHQERATEALFEGGGNWGGPGLRPAAAHFTSCRLTERGWSLAKQLLDLHPHYRQDICKRRRAPASG